MSLWLLAVLLTRTCATECSSSFGPALLQKSNRVSSTLPSPNEVNATRSTQGQSRAKEDVNTVSSESNETENVLSRLEGLVVNPEIEEIAADIYWPLIGQIFRSSHWGKDLLPEGIGVSGLLNEVEIHIWSFFLVAIFAAALLRHNWLWPEEMKRMDQHMISLGGWLSFAAVFAVCIAALMGQDHCEDWIAGYFLEFFFMVENVFVFQSVVKSIELPASSTLYVLKIVLWGQMIFEAIFFVGLAHYLRTLRFLPHILGLALLYFGLSTIIEGIPHSFAEDAPSIPQSDSHSSVAGQLIRSLSSGKSLSELGDLPENQLMIMKGGIKLTLAGWTLAALLLTDFMFEIDTVLTKIEEIDNHFISLSSSAVAAFALPELYMISEDLMYRFPHLKYGIGGVLCMFGVQLMAAPVVCLSPFASCLLMFAILAVSMLISVLRSYFARSPDSASSSGLSAAMENQSTPAQ